ncbi:MAG: hypothetical protein H7833_04900 [Magnetococcus sp. DMHC-1]|nr:hypothetical protein [Magnetococcales bacterium]
MKRRGITVCDQNFRILHGLIRDMIDSYRLNAENWVVDQFRDIHENPTESSIAALQFWIDHDVSLEFANQLVATMEQQKSLPEKSAATRSE